jgi:UDP-N-acetylmuramate: L-alanyl-gamma-D-glutamyl-meso-diaminopimelate ligase
MADLPTKIHFAGACGRTVGSLALDLKRRGVDITASDEVFHSPMDRVLADAGLKIREKFSARNVAAGTELVVAGGMIGPDNPEWRAARRRGIPVLPMAEFLGKHFPAGQKRLVVAGTNGKTTTTAMLAWILKQTGKDPDWLLGGLCPHFELPVRFRGSRRMVLEGDEYRTGLADPRPKFRHYRPHVLVVTNLHFDHAEIFASLDEIRRHFVDAARELPKNGLLLLGPDVEGWRAIAAASRAPVVRVGWGKKFDAVLSGFRVRGKGMVFEFGGTVFRMPDAGRMLAVDAALAARAAAHIGISLEKSARALAEFQGVMRRLQPLHDSERLAILVDEAYHPAAIRENIAALRLRYPGRRLAMLLQPRFTEGRGGFQERELPGILTELDRLILLVSSDPQPFPGGKFSSYRLAASLRGQGLDASLLRRTVELAAKLPPHVRTGDVWYLSLPAGREFLTDPLLTNLRNKLDP